MSKVFRFRLNLTYRECQQYYQGDFSAIQVVAHTGQTVQFPAEHIRQFVTASGVQGMFEMEVDHQNRFRQLRKLI
ncbi:MAG: DUF2835 domain-containing protein [Gammaproteobacteria bacterium]|nr:DUF2835 domain-containing protein [Gammaproteobacteria bacterium]